MDMNRRTAPWLAAGLIAALSTASLLAGLRHALARRERRPAPLDEGEAERTRIRAAMGGLLAPPVDSSWELEFGALPDGFDRQTFLASRPHLDPPLSQTISEDRDEAPY